MIRHVGDQLISRIFTDDKPLIYKIPKYMLDSENATRVLDYEEASFGGYTIFSILAYGVTDQKIKNLQSLTPLFVFILISFIIALIARDSKRKKHEIAKAVSEKMLTSPKEQKNIANSIISPKTCSYIIMEIFSRHT